MVPTADRQKATVLVRIGFNALDPRILPDMGVKVTFLRRGTGRGRAGGPAGGARAQGRGARATAARATSFVVKQDTVERRAVQTGGTDGDRLEVTGGLSSGERVVVSPPADAR